MDCPKCTGELVAARYGDEIEIQRCNVCAGLWVYPDDLQRMKSTWLAEAVLDTGSPRVGKSLDEVDDIDCPLGHGPMLKRVDPEQSHIWYEQCPVCDGIFLDAGEFTDMKFETLLDRVRGVVKGRRDVD